MKTKIINSVDFLRTCINIIKEDKDYDDTLSRIHHILTTNKKIRDQYIKWSWISQQTNRFYDLRPNYAGLFNEMYKLWEKIPSEIRTHKDPIMWMHQALNAYEKKYHEEIVRVYQETDKEKQLAIIQKTPFLYLKFLMSQSMCKRQRSN